MKLAPTALALVYLLSNSETQAATLIARGEISGTFGQGDQLAALGDQFELIVTFDSSTPDSDPTDYFGQYFDPSLSISLNILGSGTTLLGTEGSITVITADRFDRAAYPAAEVWISSSFDGIGPILALLQDDDASVVTSDSLSEAFGSLHNYSLAGFSILEPPRRVSNDVITPPLVSGRFDALVVPEPSTLWLVMLGSVVATRRKRSG